MIQQKRQIIPYTTATLNQLDAGVCVAYPRVKANGYRYFAVPSFLIVGAAKCGTTELLTWLRQHPNLQASSQEANFFNEVIDIDTEWSRYVLNPNFQISKNPKHSANCQVYTFEKTPAYFWEKNKGMDTAAMVKKMMPSGKFIIILRNPTDRAYSVFKMGKRGTKINPAWARDTADSFEAYLQRGNGLSVSTNKNALKVGHYAKHLKNWLKHFSKEQLLILTMEDFKKAPFELINKIQHFLDIPLFNYQTLAEQTDRGFWVLKGQPSKAHNQPYEAMKPETRQLLDNYYAPWNEQLRQLFPEMKFPW